MTDLYGPEFFTGRTQTVLMSASVVVPAIISLLDPESVLDLGCGQGEWVHTFIARGVKDVVGVDVAAPENPNLIRHDLTTPFDAKRGFDLVLCLETGEHLPECAADVLVDSCAVHSDMIVFSAAVPGQEGKGHINCQPHEYWHEKFEDRGFEMIDVFRRILHGNAKVSPWYRDNIFLYQYGL